MPEFLYYEVYDNTILKYLLFIVLLIVCIIVLKIAGHFLLKHFTRHTGKAKSAVDDHLIKSIKKYVIPALFFTALYLNTKILVISERLSEIIDMLILGLVTVMAALFASSIIVMVLNKFWDSAHKDANKELALKTISGLLKIVIWAVAIILFLDNMGIKITTLIAGVGIGGIAIAFAAQAILGDVFCFFTIFFDQPFEIGDFIVAGEQMGTVEYIGLKTTRLRALNGEQLIISNTDLTSSRIQNYKTMEQRRVLFTISVTYDTSHDKLARIPGLIRGIIEKIENTQYARTHFVSYGDSGLNFEIVYYVLSSDYDTYMNIHHTVNIAIKQTFENEGIKFALPARTVRLDKYE